MANTQDALSAMEVELMEAREKLAISNKLRKDLVKWKLQTSEELETLQTKVSKFEKWNVMDIERVLSDHERDIGLTLTLSLTSHSGFKPRKNKRTELVLL